MWLTLLVFAWCMINHASHVVHIIRSFFFVALLYCMRVFFFYPKIVDEVLITRLMGNRSSHLVLANEIASFSVEPHTGHANLCKQREMGRWRELERER